MRVALFCTVAVGIAIGAFFPAARPEAAEPVRAASVRAEPKRHKAPPGETVLERSPAGHFYAVAEVNGEPVRFLVDTGASTIALTQDDARRARLPFDPSRFEPVARGASGLVRGQQVTVNRIVLDGKRATGLSAIVMEGGETSLLGQNYLRKLDVRIKDDTMTLR